jgi:DNA primase catalytic core
MSFTDAAERVKSGLDIVDIIQRHVILKKSGRNYTGKCPFHNDKSPSMNVSREKGIFKCFACGVGGDALTFIMRLRNQTFGEVIRELAEDQGIEIIEEGRNPEVAVQQRDAKQKILDLNLTANQWFQDRLQDPASEPIMQYLTRRYPDATMRQAAISQFQLGYAPAGWENLSPFLKTKFDFVQSNPDLLVTAGLSNSREHGQGHYDRFRHRLIIPIHDDKGQVVAFGGRALLNQDGEEDKPKYLNSPETSVYHKSNVLYGFYQAKEAIRTRKAAVIMEGYFDVMSAHLAGITEAVGSCGTAMTDSHLKLLTRFGAETVYLAFDSDEAGLKAALSAIQLIEPYMDDASLQMKVLIVPDGKDPDDFIRQNGGGAFRKLMDEAQPHLKFKFDMAIRDIPINTSDGRIQATNRLIPLLIRLASRKNKNIYIEYIKMYADILDVDHGALELEVQRYINTGITALGASKRDFHSSGKKKAISKQGPTSLKRNQHLLTESVLELRANLSLSRQVEAEKNILRLCLYNPESYDTMMCLMTTSESISLSHPVHREILDGLRALWHNTGASPASGQINLMGDESLGTLLDKMNQLYLNQPDVLHTFAELVLTAESFCDSLGLGELKGPKFREKIEFLAEQQANQLARCRKMEQLQMLKTHAQQNEGEQIELLYQFQDRLQGEEQAQPPPHPALAPEVQTP